MTAKTLNILISGAGIAGPTLALFLARLGHKCTILETALQFRQSGQQIDVSGEGRDVVKAMGIEDAIFNHTVDDEGLQFVDSKGNVVADFPTSGDSGLVKEIEILRPDLANVIFEATKERADFRFGERIEKLEQSEKQVTVTYAVSKEMNTFDYVVLADGLRSVTRDMAFPSDNTKLHSLGQYAAFFTMPWQESDGTWSKWFNAPDGRCVSMRPNKKNNTTGAFLCQITDDIERLAQLSREDQQAEILKIFSGAGWETERILDNLRGKGQETFYFQQVAQAKSQSLSNDRVVLLGDAGYCPSPVSGQGITLALVGAYILAGSIATNEDHQEALSKYEEQVRPFVDNCQKLPPGVPWVVNPQTATGISILSNVLWVVSRVMKSSLADGLGSLSKWLPSLGGTPPQLPDYSMLHAGVKGG